MTLESLDFHVQTNRAFEDVEEAMSREIDVSAIQRVHHDPEQEAAVLHGGACAGGRVSQTTPLGLATSVRHGIV